MHACCGMYMEVRNSPSTVGFGVELKLSGLCGRHCYLSGHLASYKGKLYRVKIMSVVIGS